MQPYRTIRAIPAKRQFKLGNLRDASITQDEISGKWLLRFHLFKGDRILLLGGTKTPLRRFSAIPTALTIAREIGFSNVRIEIPET